MIDLTTIEFIFSDDVEAFSFTVDNSGHPDVIGLSMALNICKSPVTNFLWLATNILAKVSEDLPKRTAIVPQCTKNNIEYLKNVSYFYKVQAAGNYDYSPEIRDAIILTISNKHEEVFKGTSVELLTKLENGELL